MVGAFCFLIGYATLLSFVTAGWWGVVCLERLVVDVGSVVAFGGEREANTASILGDKDAFCVGST